MPDGPLHSDSRGMLFTSYYRGHADESHHNRTGLNRRFLKAGAVGMKDARFKFRFGPRLLNDVSPTLKSIGENSAHGVNSYPRLTGKLYFTPASDANASFFRSQQRTSYEHARRPFTIVAPCKISICDVRIENRLSNHCSGQKGCRDIGERQL